MNDLNQKLQRYLNFNNDDLAMNRAGRMSPRQIEATLQLIKFAKTLIYLAVGAMGAILALFGILFIALSPNIATILLFVLMIGMITSGAIAVVFFFVNPKIKNWEESFHSGGIVGLKGIVQTERRGRQGTKHDYFMHINGQFFRITKPHWDAFQSGVEYTIYYQEKNRYVLTAEADE